MYSKCPSCCEVFRTAHGDQRTGEWREAWDQKYGTWTGQVPTAPTVPTTTATTTTTTTTPTLHYTTLDYTTLHCTSLRYTQLHYITSTSTTTTTLHYTTLHHINFITLRYTKLHYSPLHYTPLHYTTLDYTTPQLQLELQLQLHLQLCYFTPANRSNGSIRSNRSNCGLTRRFVWDGQQTVRFQLGQFLDYDKTETDRSWDTHISRLARRMDRIFGMIFTQCTDVHDRTQSV